jgi:hypothetical protein
VKSAVGLSPAVFQIIHGIHLAEVRQNSPCRRLDLFVVRTFWSKAVCVIIRKIVTAASQDDCCSTWPWTKLVRINRFA